MSKEKIIAYHDLPTVFELLTGEAVKAFDTVPPGPKSNAFYLLWRSLRQVEKEWFSYLPEAVRNDISALCASHMTLGIMMARDSDALVKLLLASNAKLTSIDEEKGAELGMGDGG